MSTVQVVEPSSSTSVAVTEAGVATGELVSVSKRELPEVPSVMTNGELGNDPGGTTFDVRVTVIVSSFTASASLPLTTVIVVD
jgi:hypothetical protein